MLKLLSRLLFVAGLVAATSACTPPQTNAMVAEVAPNTIIEADSPLREAVRIQRIYDGRPDPIADDVIAGGPYAQALRLSLQQHTMLGGAEAPLTLDVAMMSEDLPFAGVSMTVSHVMKYTLVRDGETVFEQSVPSSHTTQFSESFLGATRVRLAIEGSVKKNISMFIQRIVAASKADPAKFGALQISEIRIL